MKVCSVDLSREGDVMIGGWLHVISVGGSITLKIQRQFESGGMSNEKDSLWLLVLLLFVLCNLKVYIVSRCLEMVVLKLCFNSGPVLTMDTTRYDSSQ